MNRQKKVSPVIGRYLYGIGGLSAITEVVFVLLFLPAFRIAGVNEIAVFVASAIGIALPAAIMPLVYAFINGSTLISTGRYHIPMAVSGLLSSLTFVLLLAVGKSHPVAQGFALFGLTFAFSLSMQIFLYAYYSVGRRLDSGGAALRMKSAFHSAAVALAALMILWLWDGTRDSIRAIVCFAALVAVISLLVAYMSTAVNMPAFIRLEPRHKRKVGASYTRFFAPLSNKKVRRFSVATLLGCAAFFLAAAAIPVCVFSYVFGPGNGYKISVLVMAVLVMAGFIGITRMTRRKSKKFGAAVSIALACLQLVCSAGMAVVVWLRVPEAVLTGVTIAYAAVSGILVGALFADESGSKEYAMQHACCTPGKYYCLRNCIATFGLAVGAGLTGIVNIAANHFDDRVALVVGCGLFAVAALASAVVRRHGYADGKRKPDEPEEN